MRSRGPVACGEFKNDNKTERKLVSLYGRYALAVLNNGSGDYCPVGQEASPHPQTPWHATEPAFLRQPGLPWRFLTSGWSVGFHRGLFLASSWSTPCLLHGFSFSAVVFQQLP